DVVDLVQNRVDVLVALLLALGDVTLRRSLALLLGLRALLSLLLLLCHHASWWPLAGRVRRRCPSYLRPYRVRTHRTGRFAQSEPASCSAGQCLEQRLGRLAPVEQVADVAAAAPQRVDRGHPLKRLPARQVEDHRV